VIAAGVDVVYGRRASSAEAPALKRDRLLETARFAPSRADSVGTLAHLFLDAAGRSRVPIIQRLPSAAMGRNPLAGSAHVTACNQSISPTGDGRRALNGASDVRSAGLPECQGTD